MRAGCGRLAAGTAHYFNYIGQHPHRQLEAFEPCLDTRTHPAAAGRLLASHGADRDQQLIVWSPANGKQLGRARLKDSFDALAFCGSDDRLACINRDSLVGAAMTGWWVLGTPAASRRCCL